MNGIKPKQIWRNIDNGEEVEIFKLDGGSHILYASGNYLFRKHYRGFLASYEFVR